MANFGELLAELRCDRKMTQIELAKALFVSPGTISNYEKGVHYPDIEKLMDIADFFHVSIDYLLGRSSYVFLDDVLNKQLSTSATVGQLVGDICQLDSKRISALLQIIKDMKFCHDVINHSE